MTALLLFSAAFMAQGDLSGEWVGHCGWGAAVTRTRHHHRLVRVITPDSIEVLEWSAEWERYDDASLRPWYSDREIVVEPVRATFRRESGNRFRAQDRVIEFGAAEGDLDLCQTMGGEYQLKKELAGIKPSFSCQKASQPRERAICASPQLSLLDRHLALAYQAAQDRMMMNTETKAQGQAVIRKLQALQSAWWSNTLAKCQSADCVEPLYTARIAELTAMGRKPETR